VSTHREKFEALRREEIDRHETAMSALDTLISLIDDSTGMIPPKVVELIAMNLDDAPVITAPMPPGTIAQHLTLEHAIYELMESQQESYFTAESSWGARQIFYMLESRGYPFTQSTDAGINAVSTVLIRMMDKGILERTAKGTGRSPSLYRWIRAENRPPDTAKNYVASWKSLPTSTHALVDLADRELRGHSFSLYDVTEGAAKFAAQKRKE
jgi:hypothetical protein